MNRFCKKPIKNTYTVMMLIQATMCNPNGDPDMGNFPRQDPETGYGIITDVAVKRRIRNYIEARCCGVEGYDILMKKGVSLNWEIAKVAAEVCGVTDPKKDIITGGKKEEKKLKGKQVEDAGQIMCDRFWDARTFGGVLSTGLNAGQVQGPVQVAMSVSEDPIDVLDMGITRMCYSDGAFTKLQDYENEYENRPEDKKRTMGDKKVAAYGLYLVKATISPALAAKTGFSEEDLELFFESMIQAYEFDNSASKQGMCNASPLMVFKHVGTHPETPEQNEMEAMLGCAKADKLFKLLSISKKEGVESPRSLSDYNIEMKDPGKYRGIIFGVKDNAFDEIEWEAEKVEEILNDNGIITSW